MKRNAPLTPLDQKRYLVTTNTHKQGQLELAKDILARIQAATKSTKNNNTSARMNPEKEQDRTFPQIDTQKIHEDKERRFLYNLAKRSGAHHRNAFNKT